MGRVISWIVSTYLNRPVRVFFDEVWMRQEGEIGVPLEADFWGRLSAIKGWLPNAGDKVDVVGGWWFLHYTPQPNDIVIDVGAGMGEDSQLFSRLVGEQGRVYSFEAHPFTFLCLNQALYYSQIHNTVAVQAAVFSEQGTLHIEDLAGRWADNSVISAREPNGNKTIAVSAITLDDFEPLQQHAQIQFLKMNIEGAEIAALRGMPKTLAKVQHACIACHDFLADESPGMRTKEACRQILHEAGFQVFATPADSPPWQRDHLHAVRTA